MTGVRHIDRITGPLDAAVTLPGSKSITNRALVCAALATGTSTLVDALDADDTRAMMSSFKVLGVAVERRDSIMSIVGCGGRFSAGKVTVDARMSGTTSRFLLPLAALGTGPITVDGGLQLRARPMGDGVTALASLGVTVESNAGALPIRVQPLPAMSSRPSIAVSGAVSSQFLSGLLMLGPVLPHGLEVRVTGELRSRPYVDMTIAVMRRFGARVGEAVEGTFDVEATGYVATDMTIEPDASAASYFVGAAAVVGGRVRINLRRHSVQGDLRFADVVEFMGANVTWSDDEVEIEHDLSTPLRGVDVDMADISDTAQTLAVIAPFADSPTTITGIGFIRRKETDRIVATVAELRRCGVEADELPDGIRIHPGTPRPAQIRTYDDHRMAMSFALIGLRTGMDILDPDCVSKTFPGFWDTLDSLRQG